jgi:hypothetical protein
MNSWRCVSAWIYLMSSWYLYSVICINRNPPLPQATTCPKFTTSYFLDYARARAPCAENGSRFCIWSHMNIQSTISNEYQIFFLLRAVIFYVVKTFQRYFISRRINLFKSVIKLATHKKDKWQIIEILLLSTTWKIWIFFSNTTITVPALIKRWITSEHRRANRTRTKKRRALGHNYLYVWI